MNNSNLSPQPTLNDSTTGSSFGGSSFGAEANGSGNVVIDRNILAEFPLIILCLLSIVLALWATSHFPGSVQSVDFQKLIGIDMTVGIPLFWLLPIVLLVTLLQKHLNFRYVLTPEYILEIQGRMQFRRHSIRLHYPHIRGIEIEQTILEQVLGIGDVRITSDVTRGDGQILMKGIGRPHHVKDLVEAKVQAAIKTSQI